MYRVPSHAWKALKKKAPNLTFRDVKDKALEQWDLNYLEQSMLYGCLKEASTAREIRIKQEASIVRERLFKHTSSRQKWPKKLIPGSAVEKRQNENKIIYEGRLPNTFIKQRDIYDLFIRQLVAPMNPFRSRIEANLGIEVDWTAIDKTKLFISTQMESFMWRSCHGLVYTNKDYTRFGVKDNESCHCGEVQTLKHLMVHCERSKRLFANFQVQFNLQEELTETERLMGIDPTKVRTKAILKKLAILRNVIVMSNYHEEIPRWEKVLHEIDRVYVLEFAVANQRDKLPSHFKSWGM